jgi:flagellar hook assembly protein FlgD
MTITVYNVLGEVVTVLADVVKSKGPHTVYWDGRDMQGGQVSSGTYLYQLRANGFVESKRMVLLK